MKEERSVEAVVLLAMYTGKLFVLTDSQHVMCITINSVTIGVIIVTALLIGRVGRIGRGLRAGSCMLIKRTRKFKLKGCRAGKHLETNMTLLRSTNSNKLSSDTIEIVSMIVSN